MAPTVIANLLARAAHEDVYERIIEGAYASFVAPGDVVVDGGAHAGRHSLPLARLVGASGRVLAFEPIPYLADSLRRRAQEAGLPQCVVHQAALGHSRYETTFQHVRNNPAYSGLRPRRYPFEPDVASVTATVHALDEFPDDLVGLSFVKLDLEGGEFDALRGAGGALRRERPIVAFENGRAVSAEAYGYSEDEFFLFFDSIDYVVSDLFGRPLTRSLWRAPDMPWCYWAEPAERRAVTLSALPPILDAVARS